MLNVLKLVLSPHRRTVEQVVADLKLRAAKADDWSEAAFPVVIALRRVEQEFGKHAIVRVEITGPEANRLLEVADAHPAITATDRLRARVHDLEDALKWYADPSNYFQARGSDIHPVARDRGWAARKALAGGR